MVTELALDRKREKREINVLIQSGEGERNERGLQGEVRDASRCRQCILPPPMVPSNSPNTLSVPSIL